MNDNYLIEASKRFASIMNQTKAIDKFNKTGVLEEVNEFSDAPIIESNTMANYDEFGMPIGVTLRSNLGSILTPAKPNQVIERHTNPLLTPAMIQETTHEPTNRRITETHKTNNDVITISKAELQMMIQESLLTILPKIVSTYEEEAIKKTIKVILAQNKKR